VQATATLNTQSKDITAMTAQLKLLNVKTSKGATSDGIVLVVSPWCAATSSLSLAGWFRGLRADVLRAPSRIPVYEIHGDGAPANKSKTVCATCATLVDVGMFEVVAQPSAV